jgi:hypothetical protein
MGWEAVERTHPAQDREVECCCEHSWRSVICGEFPSQIENCYLHENS